MSKEQIGFEDLADSKQIKSIDTADIHRNFFLNEVEFVPRQEKKEKKKNEKGETVEVGTGKMVGPYIKFGLKNHTGDVGFNFTMFTPPTTEEEVKFTSDKYENGIAVRKNTAQEQIIVEFNKKFYFFEQLAKAIGASPDNFLKFKTAVKGDPTELFKMMFDKFFALFPIDKIKTKPVDFKTVWNNNDKTKTSFLQLADAGANNIVIAMHIPERATILQFTQYESQQKLKRKYSNTDKAPKDGNTESAGNGWRPVEGGGIDDVDTSAPRGNDTATADTDEALF